jgi:hypothetical protein
MKIPYLHLAIQNVPNRSGICVHVANKYSELLGCVAVGKGYGDLNKDGEMDVLQSRITFERLMAVAPDHFTLTIE